MREIFDAAVIGGGILGCFAARNLRRRNISTVLIEAREDVCTGITRANSAIVYTGCDSKPNTLKTRMTVAANARFDALCRELDVKFSRCGSLLVSCGENGDETVRRKYAQGIESGVPGLRILRGAEARAMEPELSEAVTSALYCPTAGTVNPWQLGIAACENAVANGAVLRLNTRVTGISRENGGYVLQTDRGEIFARAVLNCTGLCADRIQELCFPPRVRTVVDGADYLVLDKSAAHKPSYIIMYESEAHGKGVSAVPTVTGEVLLGPVERPDAGAFVSTAEGLRRVREEVAEVLPQTDFSAQLRSFAASRPNPFEVERGENGYVLSRKSINSFVIDEPAEGFVSFIGIKTPGLTCADELGRYAAEKLGKLLGAAENPDFDPFRRGIRAARDMSEEERAQAVRDDPDYGEIVCRCEGVTLREVKEAIRRGAVTVDGVKRRCGSGMGACQGARCRHRIAEVLKNGEG